MLNEFLKSENYSDIDLGLLKWLSILFDTFNGDYYFPWKDIDFYILTYNEINNSEYIKKGIRNIQLKFIEENGGNINELFEKEFNIKI